jgi:hypothetical protein
MRRRRWIRRIGAIFGTLVLGGLLGFLIPTVVSEYAPQPPVDAALAARNANNAELPIAREFINAFVANDQAKLHAIGADETSAVKANDLAGQVAQIGKPVLLGALGAPGASLQAYAAQAVMRDGTQTILSWRVLTVSGRVGLVLPPSPLNPNP